MMCSCAGKGSLHDASCDVVKVRDIFGGLFKMAWEQPNCRLTHYTTNPRGDHRRFKSLLSNRWIASMELGGDFTVLLDNGSEIVFCEPSQPPSAA